MATPSSAGAVPDCGEGAISRSSDADPSADPAAKPVGSAPDAGLRRTFSTTLLISLAALAAVAPLATDTYLPAFAQMAEDLRVSASSVQLTMTTFLAGVALGQLSIGVLSDRAGRRPLLLWGSVLAFVASICSAVAPALPLLLIARFFQGLGGAAGMVLGRAVIADRSRGITATQALSLVMAIQGIAPVAAPILGGLLVEPIGWRGILGVVAAFTGVLVLMVAFWVPESLPAAHRRDGGLRLLIDGTRELVRDRVLVRLLVINALAFGLLMSYLSAAPFVLRNVLGMGTAAYTGVFGLCGATVTVMVSVSASLARRFPQVRQVRAGLLAVLAVDVVFAAVCLIRLRGPVDGVGRAPLLVGVIALFLVHVACLGPLMGNVPALALDRTGRWAGTGSALLGFIQFVVGGLVSPLVGLTGEASGAAFGVVIVGLGVIANVLAAFGLRGKGDKGEERLPEEAERRRRRLGR